MTKSEKTKKYIIESAAPVFNMKGYAGTSLSDLTQATGLTKGSIYGNFENKEEIAVHVFKYAIKKIRQTAQLKLDAETDNLGKLFTYLDFFLEYALNPPVPGGCVLLNTAVEADDNQPVLRKQVSHELNHSINHITMLLEGAITAGSLKNEIDTKSMAYNIFCAVEGAIMMSRVQNTIQPMQEVIKYWKNQIRQLQVI